MRTLLVALAIIVTAPSAFAGVIELGLSGSYRRSNISEDAYDISQSLTGSFSYYFAESSAIEVSYTDGYSKRFIPSTTSFDRTTSMYYSLLGVDLVLSIGGRDAPISPYIKIGAARYLEKKIVDQFEGFEPETIKEEPATVPSAGVGMKILLTKTFSIKIGAEAWTSNSLNKKPIRIDYAGRAGISWMF